MRLPFGEILLRTKEGPFIEEKAFDLSIFKKTQELQKNMASDTILRNRSM